MEFAIADAWNKCFGSGSISNYKEYDRKLYKDG
jgi:hypothetical protein